ncbi:MAG: hypothetical protein JJE04_16685 [Acidobacteriia bacterium]|nr:hypothetical protein [Terriglobia bacterium]
MTAALCAVAYLPSLGLPFISDDYLQIMLGRKYGPVESWSSLAGDALYRCRATSIVLTWWLEQWFGAHALIFKLVSLGIHIFNTWLVFALGVWKPVGWRLSAVAAAFFAIYEGHQEAVIWFAAVPELLVFFFSLASLLVWVLWIQDSCKGWLKPTGALLLFLLALLSKEPAVVLPALFLLTALVHRDQWRPIFSAFMVMIAVAGIYTFLIFAAKTNHLHFNDGTFSLAAPFLLTLANSTIRMLWFWGALSLMVILLIRPQQWRVILAVAGAWVLITFLPYSFLTYMTRVPSRHTYFASAALSIVVGLAFLTLLDRFRQQRRWLSALLVTMVIAHNCGYLWIKKQDQYLARAEPTQRLIQLGRSHTGPIRVRCFPYGGEVAVTALQVQTGRQASEVIIGEDAGDGGSKDTVTDFCYDRMP